MNGIDKITERIAADSGSEIQALLERADTQAKEIVAGYQAAADQDYQDAVKQGKRSAAERIERMDSVSQLEARKLHLQTKQEMLNQAYDLARKKLLRLSEEEYISLLIKLAVKGAETGSEALVFSETDRNRCGKQVVLGANERLKQQGHVGALTLSEESRSFQGGLYLQNGNVETNCTFDALIRAVRQDSTKEIAEILFD